MLALAASFLLSATSAPVVAQETQGIVALVNDEPITGYDLDQRIRMVISSSGLQANRATARRLRPEVLRRLVDERLQRQEADRQNVTVSDDEIQATIARIARDNNMSEDQFRGLLNRGGIDISSLEQQIRTQLVWRKLVARRFGSAATPGEDEIDAVLKRITANIGKPESLLGEIFFAVDSPDREAEVRTTAEKIAEQLKQGAQFPALARQFSQGPSAAAGGDAGWVLPGQLPPEIEKTVKGMKVGQLVGPIRSLGGYYILLLRDRRRVSAADPLAAELTLKQLVIPIAGNEKDAMRRAKEFAARLKGCDDVDGLAKETGSPLSGSLGTVKLRDLPEHFRRAVADLAPGQSSKPVPTKTGIHVFVVCARKEAASSLPDREQVRQTLFGERLTMMAQRYLRDLRRVALLEIRR